MEATFNGYQAYRLDRLPAWKQEIWRQISKDALDRGAFDADNYDGEYLKPYMKAHHDLYRWLAAIDDPSTFDTLSPLWEHIKDGEWRLLFVEGAEDRVPVKGWLGGNSAGYGKPIAIRIPGRGGLVVDGVSPENDVGDDWEIIDKKHVPPRKSIPTDANGGAPKSRCQIL